ncbi:hypothetical protein [Pseudomonas sp. zfem003]|uniref:hypothetical protein n=1 Tax=Pseudomonas sp. zfem003 TaxID=3078198 RepID=UPI002928A7F6|nr:hypothetical protein [Pseudomonas sp. zfem003]MDU9398071.1 hypothetical protein [Pseudomonas sp. zfem003]
MAIAKKTIIDSIRSYTTGFLTYKSSLERRIADLHDIEYAAQEAREKLEAELDNLDEKRDPIAWGYMAEGIPWISRDEGYAERVSTCMVTPLYTEEDVKRYRAGEK